jgi:hypothetical protein
VIKVYRQILNQNEQSLPDDFKLQSIIDTFADENDKILDEIEQQRYQNSPQGTGN